MMQGSNMNGVLGVPGIEASSEPMRVETELRFVELAANYFSTCGGDASGQLHCWGAYGAETPISFGADLRCESPRLLPPLPLVSPVDPGGLYPWLPGGSERGGQGARHSSRAAGPGPTGPPPATTCPGSSLASGEVLANRRRAGSPFDQTVKVLTSSVRLATPPGWKEMHQ